MKFAPLFLAVASVAGLTIRNHVVPFHQGRQLGPATPLLFIKTGLRPLREDVGIVAVAGEGAYLVNENSPAHHRLRGNSTGEAPLLPLYKYSSTDELHLLVTVAPGAIAPYNPFCHFRHFARDTWLGRCNAPATLALAQLPYVVTIDAAPRIRMHTQTNETAILAVPPYVFQSLPFPIVTAKMIITDTALDRSHCMFYQRTIEVRNVPGWTDTTGVAGSHGTVTSGIAVGDLCIGISGVAPGAPLIFADISPVGGSPESLIVPPGFFDILFVGSPQIHSASWGSPTNLGQYTQVSALYDAYIYYDNQWTAHFIAVGNGGIGAAGSPPSTAKNVLPCGSLNAAGGISSFTSTGTLADGRRSPLIWARGEYVWAAYGFAVPDGAVANHKDFSTVSGTSAATPPLAAIALGFVERRGTRVHESLVRAAMINHYGNEELPFNEIKEMALTGSVANGEALTASAIWYKCFEAPAAMETKAVLAWTDVPSVAFPAMTLENDVDMFIVHDDGMSRGEDALHTHEMVEAQLLSPFRIVVYAYAEQMTFPPLYFSVHVNQSLVPSSTCGGCLPGDLSLEGCSEGEKRQCLPSGLFTPCSSCSLGFILKEGICACSPGVFVRNQQTLALTQACRSTRVSVKVTSAAWPQQSHNHLSGGRLIYLLSLIFLFV